MVHLAFSSCPTVFNTDLVLKRCVHLAFSSCLTVFNTDLVLKRCVSLGEQFNGTRDIILFAQSPQRVSVGVANGFNCVLNR